jgi:hypothetical protein
MARDVRRNDGRFPLPGVYQRCVVGSCRCGNPCRSDPRRWLEDLTEGQRAELELAKAQCQFEAMLDRNERLAAGEPYTVSRLCFGGHSIPREDSWPAWLRDHHGGVRSVRVFADDTIAPAEDD